ncbi:MAG: hypothetical protein LBV15_01025, partial [Planctomycetota bacterium]|nr:hypothetical protein [Planctomycetota bacterium]
MTKALLLLSGGLDSTLAGKMLLELGVEVEAVNFTSPFCRCTPKSFGCSAAKLAADTLGIPVRMLVKGEDYLEIVKHPRHGRGSGMNPCLDCRIFTFRRARELMPETGADFIATGEVLGQRPMSQRGRAMELIEREAGLEGLVVRPLSAQLLPPSRPEREGRLDRSRLLAIQGRSRREQMTLAKDRGIDDYPCPAGGCLLTDPEFAARLRELLAREPSCGLNDVLLLSRGRHFRLPGGAKAVVGRNEEENLRLENLARPGDWLLGPGGGAAGPTVLLRPGADPGEIGPDSAPLAFAAGLLALFTREGKEGGSMEVVRSRLLPDGGRESVPP